MLKPSDILQYAGEFINASDAHKGAFICWMAVPVYCFIIIWCAVTLWLSQYYDGMYNPILSGFAIWCAIIGFLYIPLGIYQLTLRDNPDKNDRYTYFILLFYTLTTMTTCYMLGPLTVMTGIVVMGSPMLGLMLFSNKQIGLTFVIGLIYLVTITLLGIFNVIPYTPVFGRNSSDYFIVCCVFASAMYVGYESIIMASLISAWRNRESGVKHLSVTDTLTGVANRRHIMTLLEQEFSQSRFAKRGLSDQYLGLVMVDIDHFKRINDSHGHRIGDKVLRETANKLGNCLRQQDHVGRYGGEEFLIVLPGTLPEEAVQIAERCREAITKITLPGRKTPLLLTASFGVVCREKSDVHDLGDFIHKADLAMYEAKREGRNRVVSFNNFSIAEQQTDYTTIGSTQEA